jgi:hypothetical protein
MFLEWLPTLIYVGLFLGGAALVLFPKRFKPQTVVRCGETSIGLVVGQKEGWVEVLQPLLKEGQVEYRTETFVPEKLKCSSLKEPIAQTLHQLAPLLLHRNQLLQQHRNLTDRLQKLQKLLSPLKSSSIYANRMDLLQRTYQQLLNLEKQNSTLLETLDHYVQIALLHAQAQQTANDLDQLPDPVTLYLQQQKIQEDLQSLQSELSLIDTWEEQEW